MSGLPPTLYPRLFTQQRAGLFDADLVREKRWPFLSVRLSSRRAAGKPSSCCWDLACQSCSLCIARRSSHTGHTPVTVQLDEQDPLAKVLSVYLISGRERRLTGDQPARLLQRSQSRSYWVRLTGLHTAASPPRASFAAASISTLADILVLHCTLVLQRAE